jgi:hypothetical protein
MPTEAQPAPIAAAAHLIFGARGNAGPSQVSGFGAPEGDSTWALGPQALLRVKLQPGDGDLMLELSLTPYVTADLPRQRIGVAVNGRLLGTEWARVETVLGFRIPADLIAGRGEIELMLALPDARAAPGGARLLGCQVREALLVWVPPEPPAFPRRLSPLGLCDSDPPERTEELVRFCTGMAIGDIMPRFESLGHNSEFGYVQQSCGIDAPSLLRFADIPTRRLLLGLDFGFEDIDDPRLLHAYRSDDEEPEWILQHDRYDMHIRSFVRAAGTDTASVVAQQAKRLAQQRSRLLDVLESGEHLFVFQRDEHLSQAHVLPILTLLRSYGPNALLFVSADEKKPSGSVDLLGPHLFRGNIDRLAPRDNPKESHRAAWMSICANAYRMWRVTGHGS